MNDKIKKLIDGWHNETNEEKSNDINEFITRLITEKENDIQAEYQRKIHGMIMVAEMRIDEIKKTKPRLIKLLKFEQNQNKNVNHEISYRIKKIKGKQGNYQTIEMQGVHKEYIRDSYIGQTENTIQIVHDEDNNKQEEINIELSDKMKDNGHNLVSEKEIINTKEENISHTDIIRGNKKIEINNDQTDLIADNQKKTLECIIENDNKTDITINNKYNIKILNGTDKGAVRSASDRVSSSNASLNEKTQQVNYNIKTLKSKNDSNTRSGSEIVNKNTSPKEQTGEINYKIKMLKSTNKKFKL